MISSFGFRETEDNWFWICNYHWQSVDKFLSLLMNSLSVVCTLTRVIIIFHKIALWFSVSIKLSIVSSYDYFICRFYILNFWCLQRNRNMPFFLGKEVETVREQAFTLLQRLPILQQAIMALIMMVIMAFTCCSLFSHCLIYSQLVIFFTSL